MHNETYYGVLTWGKNPIKKILENTHEGAIILLHPTSKTNAEILPILIDKWREMGYSFGTLDELSEVLTMVQTGKIKMIPIIFVGSSFWSGMIQWFKENLAAEGMISPEDMNLFKVVDTAEEAVEYLTECHRYSRCSSVK